MAHRHGSSHHDPEEAAGSHRHGRTAGNNHSRSRTRHVEDAPPPESATEASASAKPDTDADERVRRAEEMIDRFAARVGDLTAKAGHTLLRWGARAREEMEDIWAEAQEIRRSRQA